MIFKFKRCLSVWGVIVMIFSLCGCRNFYFEYEDEKAIQEDAKNLIASLLQTIEDGDKEAFRTFFADHVLSQQDYSNGENYVFEIFNGAVQTIEQDSLGTGGRFSPGERTTHAFLSYDVVTDENEYVMYMEYYTKNTENQRKIRKFKILEKEGCPETGCFSDMSQRYGIYYPGWLEDTE